MIVTFTTEFLVLGASLVVLRLATHRWGPAGFGEYVLARRSLGWVQLPVLCGMHLALARYVAMAAAAENEVLEAAYLRGGAVILALSLALMVVILLVASRPLAFLLLGTSDAARTMRLLILPIAGQVMHTATYGALRGRRMVHSANGLQAVNLGVLPIALLLLPGITVTRFVATIGVAWIGSSLVAVFGLSLLTPRIHVGRPALGRSVRELFRYGFPRVPGEVALGALFTLPVTFAAHLSGPIEAGRVGLGLSLLQIIGAMFAPLGQVLLPAISARLARGELPAVRDTVRRTALIGVLLAVLAVAALELLCVWLFRVFFGEAYLPAVPLVRVIALAGIPYGTYVLLRSVLDAMHHRPMNAHNLVYGIVAFLVVALLVNSTLAVPLAVVAAMAVLGGRTVYDVYRSLFGAQAMAAVVAGPNMGAQT